MKFAPIAILKVPSGIEGCVSVVWVKFESKKDVPAEFYRFEIPRVLLESKQQHEQTIWCSPEPEKEDKFALGGNPPLMPRLFDFPVEKTDIDQVLRWNQSNLLDWDTFLFYANGVQNPNDVGGGYYKSFPSKGPQAKTLLMDLERRGNLPTRTMDIPADFLASWKKRNVVMFGCLGFGLVFLIGIISVIAIVAMR